MVTRFKPREIEDIIQGMESGTLHPRDVKMNLAKEIVAIFHSTSDAQIAEQEFVRVFRQSQIPEKIPEYQLKAQQTLLDVLDQSGLISTRSEGRRLINEGAVRLEGKTVTDVNIILSRPGVLQVGKRKFLRLLMI